MQSSPTFRPSSHSSIGNEAEKNGKNSKHYHMKFVNPYFHFIQPRHKYPAYRIHVSTQTHSPHTP